MTKQVYHIIVLMIVCVLLSILSFHLNARIFHYPGNTYFPDGNLQTSFILSLIYLAIYFQTGWHSRLTQTMTLFVGYYIVFAILSMFANATQYTPFAPNDQTILKMEPFNLLAIVAWTKQHPMLEAILVQAYNSLSIEMIVLPLLLVLSLKTEVLYEYFILIMLTAIIGFGFYYFYPTSGPASILDSPYFYACQRATGIKFFEIHHHITPSTREGGLIALPSFHVIWACLMVHITRPFRLLYWIALPYNMLIIVACIMLGWHYMIDVCGSALVLSLAYGFCKMHGTTAKRSKSSSENHPCIQ